jgi:hypothetical protein
MPIEYSIDPENAIIRTRCFGAVTLEEVLDHFGTLAADPHRPDRLDVLLDLSEQTSLPRPGQLLEVAHAIRRVRDRVQFRAVAIVALTNALYGMLRIFEVLTEQWFGEASVFRSVDQAEIWLATQVEARQSGRQRTSGSPA